MALGPDGPPPTGSGRGAPVDLEAEAEKEPIRIEQIAGASSGAIHRFTRR